MGTHWPGHGCRDIVCGSDQIYGPALTLPHILTPTLQRHVETLFEGVRLYLFSVQVNRRMFSSCVGAPVVDVSNCRIRLSLFLFVFCTSVFCKTEILFA